MVETPSIPPSSPANPTRLTAVSSGPVGVGQQPAAQQAATMRAGSVLTGTVTDTGAKGQITLETAAMKLVLQSAIALPRNAQVTVRVEQPVNADAMPTVRILTVDGKPVSQYLQQMQQGNAPATQNPMNPAETARPTAQVIEMSARSPDAAKAANTPETQLQAAVGNRAIPASQLSLSAIQTLPAMLLRPMLTAKTAEVLDNLLVPLLDAKGKPLPQAAQPQQPPPLTQEMLRSGLQLQVRIIDIPKSSAQVGAPPPVPAAGGGIAGTAPVGANPASPTLPNVPISATSAPVVTPAASPVLPPTPNAAAPAQMPSNPTAQPIPTAQVSAEGTIPKTGYAAYAKQPAASLPTTATPPPVQIPASGASTPSIKTPAIKTPAIATPTSASPAPSIPQNAAVSQTPTPSQTIQLSPKVVDGLLASAEGKGLPAGQMAAVVVGKEQAGALTVQTRLGLFSIPVAQAGVASQAGTVFIWQVRNVLPSAQQPLPLDAAASLAAASQIGRDGSALHELVRVIQSLQGANAPQTLQRLIPQSGAALSAGMLLFMSVMKKADVASWLGKDLHDTIESSGKGDLLKRLGGELMALRSLFTGGGEIQQSNNWQAMFLPVMVGKELETAQLFVKPDDKKDKNGGGGGQRFVLELDLSAFGPMQMDGLFKRQDNQLQFNLVIRTLEALPEEVKTDIYGIFEETQKATGISGGLSFRTVGEFPVNPLEEMLTGQHGDGSIIA